MSKSAVLTPKEVVSGLVFPESPRWHEDELWFSDMHRGEVCAWNRSTGDLRVVLELPDDMSSGIGFLSDGTALVVARRSKQVMSWANGRLEVFADLSALPIDSLNDLVTDGLDRTWVGARRDWGYSHESLTPLAGSAGDGDQIIYVDPMGEWRVAAEGLYAPNGLAVTADGRRLVVAETRRQRIIEFEIHPDGTLGPLAVFADLDPWSPDGICLDDDGRVWVGVPLYGKFVRVERGGRVTEAIDCGDRWAVACVLGGPTRKELYLTVTHSSLENQAAVSAGQPSLAVGAIEVVEVPRAGDGWP